MTIVNRSLSPGVLSVLPTIYVGWADSVLSPTEMDIIHQKINSFDFLSDDDKNILISWSDPKSPPPKARFKYWLNQIKTYSSKLGLDKRRSLAELGYEIASNNTQSDEDDLWNSASTLTSLQALEEALGLNNISSRQVLFSQLKKVDPDSGISSFDVSKLGKFLDGDYRSTKERMRQLLRDPIFKITEEVDKDRKRITILKQLKALAQQGVSAYSFPKKYGGFELKGDHIAVFEMLAYHDLSLTVKFGVQFGLFGGAVFHLGTERHHRKYVEALHRAELLGCFAMTETGHGSNVKGLETTAVYDHENRELIINTPHEGASKEYIGNALHSSIAAVFCQLLVNDENQGVHAVLVPTKDPYGEILPGIKIVDNGYKMGLNGVDNGKLWFNNIRVPVDNLLDKYGTINDTGEYKSKIANPDKRFFTMLGALVVGRICVGLGGISASKVGLYIAIKYAFSRRQFGKEGEKEMSIINYPSHQKRLIPLLAKNYGYYFALRELANQYVNATEDQIRKIETLAAGLKAKATWLTTQTIQECREACGGKGYLSENRFTNLKADTDIFTTFEGDNTVLMQLVAKGKLTEYKQSFHDEGFKAVLRRLYTVVSNTMSSLNPVETRNTSFEHLTDRAFHLHAFKYRETKLLISLSNRMRNFLSKKLDPFQAFLRCQNHMIALAHAFVDRVVLKAFVREIRKAEDPSINRILSQLCDLYALSIIEEEKGWFLENNYLEGPKSKAIRKAVEKLCQQLTDDAEGLVDAFGIPPELVDAQIVDGI